MNIERKRKIALALIMLAVAVAIILPIFNRYYFYPMKWKKSFHDVAVAKYKNISETRIDQYTDCVYEYLNDKYGAVKIPEAKDYTKEDLKAGLYCVIDNLLDGDSTKVFARSHIDEVVNILWKKNHK